MLSVIPDSEETMVKHWSVKRMAVVAVVAAVVLGGGALAYGAAMPARSSVDGQLAAALAVDPGTDPGGQASTNADARQAARQAVQDCRQQHAADRAGLRQCLLAVKQQFAAQLKDRGAGRLVGGLGPKAGVGRVVHGDLVVRTKDGSFETVTVDRGKVQAVDGDRLTIVRPDGPTVTVTLDANTKYRGISGKQDLAKDTAVGVASRDGKALMVAVPKPDAAGGKKAP
jgi:hypothetical protein